MSKILHQEYLNDPLKVAKVIFLFFIAILPLKTYSNTIIINTEDKQQPLPTLDLTKVEQEWLRKHKTIRVGVKHSWKPIEFVSNQKVFRGITIDYMNKMESLLGIKFVKIDIDDITTETIDMLSSVSNPGTLNKKFTPTNPILSFRHAIYTHEDIDSINRIEDLHGKKVAVFKYGQLINYLAKDFDQIKLHRIDIIEQAFNDMSSRNIDAYIGNEMVIDYEANLNGISFLNKINYVPFETNLTMAVRKDWPVFLSILNKAFVSLEAEHNGIISNWNLSLFQKTKLSIFLGISLLTLIIGVTFFRSYKLKYRIKQQTIEAQKNIWHQAHYDMQTNLPNRMMFNIKLAQEIKYADERALPICLLYIDFDAFKEVNDLYGHATGDQLIKEAAQRIRECVKPDDIVARLGGDEFSVILTSVYDIKLIDQTSAKILKVLSSSFLINQFVINITSSIGSSIYPNNSQCITSLVQSADMAMYEAKRLGKNCHIPFTKSMQDDAEHKQQVATDLKIAITKNEFNLHYQPIIDLQTNELYKVEALIRWQHPTKGLVGPFEFIDIAEETNAIVKIGDWVFKQAIKDSSILQQSIDPKLSISINVSPKQFNVDCLISKWPSLLKEHKVLENSIGIEITEGLLLESTLSTNNILNELRKSGANILIDDFGTGYSSLSYLKKIDADYLKIDKSFIQNLSYGSDDMALCEAIIVMAHKLGLKVIAEGIETNEQKNLLYEIGCDYGQGYLFSKPVPLEVLLTDFQHVNLPLTVKVNHTQKLNTLVSHRPDANP